MWAELHAAFHANAAARVAARDRAPLDFYEMLAQKCKDERRTSKEDVLGEVVRYYVEDAKRGFSSFQLQATFGRVYALVNGVAAREFFYQQASGALFRW